MKYNFAFKKYSIDELDDIVSNNDLNSAEWYVISQNQKLTEDFIDKYNDRVNWVCISCFQNLSEEFIEKYRSVVSWNYISNHQVLSEKFIKKHKDVLYWNSIIINQKLSYELLEENLYRFSLYLSDINISKNKDAIIKLQLKYSDKYAIDKLSYEL